MRPPIATLVLICTGLLAPFSLQAQSAAGPGATAAARVIVKYKADSAPMRVRALSASTSLNAERVQVLGQRAGLALRAGASVSERTQVVFAGGMSSEQLAQRLAAQGDVEYAVPDQRRRIAAAPSDPLYLPTTPPPNGPAAGQWYLRAPAGDVRSSLDVETAWNITTGSPGVVVAVLDTGIRFDHADLKTVAASGNLLPGYDMIGDVDIANDGNGRDADPSDPGDWITAVETTQVGGNFEDCSINHPGKQDSSWHGTQVSGLIAALTDNGIGMAGVARNVRVLPVRVLGKCGGFDSDIIAGMRWAANLPTGFDGVPSNPNPAKIINLSLGGEGVCSAAYRDAMTELTAQGVVVVASAGNSAGHAVSTPANCPGVIAVAGLRHLGTKVGFSDIGPEVTISAPGGNCVNSFGTCVYPLLTTTNPGLTEPVTHANGGSVYTDGANISLGTSFSAPLVAGTAALVLSAQSTLSPADVRDLLRNTARAFPTTGAAAGTPQCQAPQPIGSAQFDQLECYCTTGTCGAGMLDAGAAVSAVGGVLARIVVNPSAPLVMQSVTFSAATSSVPAGRSISSYQWTLTNGGGIVSSFIGATDGAIASATPSAAGSFSVSVTITDSTGVRSTANSTVTVTAPPPPPQTPAEPAPISGGGGGALGGSWLLLLAAAVAGLRLASRRPSRP